jgi:hypothetical protein
MPTYPSTCGGRPAESPLTRHDRDNARGSGSVD